MEWRENQFLKQLPAYDTCPDVCHDLSDLEKKRMVKFVDMRRKKFFGVGEVETLLESKVLDLLSMSIREAGVQVKVIVNITFDTNWSS